MEHKLKKIKTQKNVVKVKEPRLPVWKLVSKLEARKKTSCEFPKRASIRVSTTLNENFRFGEVLLFTYLMVFAFGCDESSQTTSRDFKGTNIGAPWSKALRTIQESLADNDPLVRVHALEVVAATGQIRLMPQVHQLLHDKSMPVRFAAALAVGDLKYSPSKRSVSQLLKDSDANVTTAAAYAMFKLGSAQYLEALRNAIAGSDQTVRANAALLLGKSGDKGSLELLWRTMQSKDSDDRVVYQSAEAIAMLGDEQIYPKLWTMLISAYSDVRLMGVRAMGKLGTPEAKNALIRMLDDDILEIRLAAAEQLGVFKDPIGEAKVLEVFEKNFTSGLDTEARERTNVLTALAIGQICTPALTKFLPQLLQNESKFVRIAAAKAVLQCTK
jgi:HEAT repeat protein